MSCVEEAGRGRRSQHWQEGVAWPRGSPAGASRGVRRLPAAERVEKKEGGEKKEKKERGWLPTWAPLPRGVHVGETGHQNIPMVKNERFS